MPRRTSPQEIRTADDLSRMNDIIHDKRYGKRAKAKKQRRNRHYEKQILQTALRHKVVSSHYDAAEDS